MNQPFVVWFTGISSSGKTTLSKKLYRQFNKELPQLVLLDGDEIRLAFSMDLGYTEKDRHVQIKRIQNISLLLVNQGISVIVSALYSNDVLLSWNRENFTNYFEIFLDTSVETASSRDTKGLYSAALKGEIKDVVGIDIEYRNPKKPNLTVDMNKNNTPDSTVKNILKHLGYI